MTALLLSIDQGTTSSRAIIVDQAGRPHARAQQEHKQYYPAPGWVEHDAEEIWRATLSVCRAALKQCGEPIAAIGLTNQRETTVLWNAATGKPIGPAIVWQDRRTADVCKSLKDDGHEAEITRRTGLLLDPYFSASKIAWMLDHYPDARTGAEQGNVRIGTIDSYLLWRLTGGKVHATDATNASRTMLYNIHTNLWDPWLLDLFGIPAAALPEVKNSADDFGVTDPALFGAAIPIAGVAGDQQAATVGQTCFAPGMTKVTFGTGAFILLNTGPTAVMSNHRLLTTVAYRLKGQTTYALEGSVFNAGSTVQWLRDGLKIIAAASDTEALAASLPDNRGVYLVPAFTGLGAPHWQPDARGVLSGLTRDSGAAELARAALEAVAYQTHDLLAAMAEDFPGSDQVLRADGGMIENKWLMQFLADILNAPVDTPNVAETTALGAAYLAGLQIGLYDDLDHIADHWQLADLYKPQMTAHQRQDLLNGWTAALRRTI